MHIKGVKSRSTATEKTTKTQSATHKDEELQEEESYLHLLLFMNRIDSTSKALQEFRAEADTALSAITERDTHRADKKLRKNKAKELTVSFFFV